jgi:hypothetical protein
VCVKRDIRERARHKRESEISERERDIRERAIYKRERVCVLFMQKRGRKRTKGKSKRKEKEQGKDKEEVVNTPYQPDSYSYSPGNDI